MQLEHIKEDEQDIAFEIVLAGVNRLKERGIDQWQKGYPNIETIRNDYENKSGYLLKDDDKIIAYVSITTDKEDLYENIKTWHCKEEYAIVHRVSIHNDFAGQGYAKVLFNAIKETAFQLEVGCVRIDTHPQNSQMIKVIENNGFIKVDEMMYPEGLRIAFEHCLK